MSNVSTRNKLSFSSLWSAPFILSPLPPLLWNFQSIIIVFLIYFDNLLSNFCLVQARSLKLILNGIPSRIFLTNVLATNDARLCTFEINSINYYNRCHNIYSFYFHLIFDSRRKLNFCATRQRSIITVNVYFKMNFKKGFLTQIRS